MFCVRPAKCFIFRCVSALSDLLQTAQGPKVTTEMSRSTHFPCCTSESLLTCFAGKSSSSPPLDALISHHGSHTGEALAYLSGTGLSPHPPATFRSFFSPHQQLGKANSLRAMCDLLSFFSPLSVLVRTPQLEMRTLLQTAEYWRAFHACYCGVTVCAYVSRAYWEGHYPWVRAAPPSAEISLISSVMMPPDLRDLFQSLNFGYRTGNVEATTFIWKGTLSLQYDCRIYFSKARS